METETQQVKFDNFQTAGSEIKDTRPCMQKGKRYRAYLIALTLLRISFSFRFDSSVEFRDCVL